MTTSNNATIISNDNPNKIASQAKPSLTVGSNNTTPIVNSVSAPPHPPHTAPTSTNTPGSGELLYLGISSKSVNKGDNTKSAASHHSSNDDNSFDTTTKIKTQHTSSGSRAINQTNKHLPFPTILLKATTTQSQVAVQRQKPRIAVTNQKIVISQQRLRVLLLLLKATTTQSQVAVQHHIAMTTQMMEEELLIQGLVIRILCLML